MSDADEQKREGGILEASLGQLSLSVSTIQVYENVYDIKRCFMTIIPEHGSLV